MTVLHPWRYDVICCVKHSTVALLGRAVLHEVPAEGAIVEGSTLDLRGDSAVHWAHLLVAFLNNYAIAR